METLEYPDVGHKMSVKNTPESSEAHTTDRQQTSSSSVHREQKSANKRTPVRKIPQTPFKRRFQLHTRNGKDRAYARAIESSIGNGAARNFMAAMSALSIVVDGAVKEGVC